MCCLFLYRFFALSVLDDGCVRLILLLHGCIRDSVFSDLKCWLGSIVDRGLVSWFVGCFPKICAWSPLGILDVPMCVYLRVDLDFSLLAVLICLVKCCVLAKFLTSSGGVLALYMMSFLTVLLTFKLCITSESFSATSVFEDVEELGGASWLARIISQLEGRCWEVLEVISMGRTTTSR